MAGLNGAFHKHLDVCRRCADHPFNLCPIGAKALEQEAKEAMASFGGLVDLSTIRQDGRGKR
jgi:hypothetical protein